MAGTLIALQAAIEAAKTRVNDSQTRLRLAGERWDLQRRLTPFGLFAGTAVAEPYERALDACQAEHAAAKRGLKEAVRAVADAEMALVKGVAKENLTSIATQFTDRVRGRLATAEDWRARVRAVEAELARSLRAARDFALKRHHDDASVKLLMASEDAARYGAHRERDMLVKAETREREAQRRRDAAAEKKRSRGVFVSLTKMPVEILLKIFAKMDAKTRARTACVHASFAAAVNLFEHTLTDHTLSIVTARARHLAEVAAAAAAATAAKAAERDRLAGERGNRLAARTRALTWRQWFGGG
jgi:hypothetical protein